MPHDEVDVNAHPAKTEIRFKEIEMVRGFLISSLKKLITAFGASKPSTEAVNSVFQANNKPNVSNLIDAHQTSRWSPSQNQDSSLKYFKNYENKKKLHDSGIFAPQKLETSVSQSFDKIPQTSAFGNLKLKEDISEPEMEPEQNTLPEISEQSTENSQINLGTALYQIANTYIVAATNDSLILIDQHAVAERITLEKLKKSTKLDSQDLLLPEMCPLSEAKVELFEKNSDLIAKFGIVYEKMSSDVIMVNALPYILGSCEAKPLINDIADELENMGDIYSLDEKIHLILSTISCHGSLRAGRKLSIEEMNSLLRQMESTENIAQCCHGRPSYVTLTTKSLDKFFERT